MCARCLLSCHCEPPRKTLTHILFSPHQVFIYVDKITLIFLLFSPALSAPPHMATVASSPSLSSRPFAGLSPVVPHFSRSGESRAEHGTPDATSPVLRRGEGKSLVCSGLPNALRMTLVCSLVSTRTPTAFSDKAHSS